MNQVYGLKKTLPRNVSNRLTAYSFVLPALIVFTFVLIIPTISGFYYSFTDWSGMTKDINIIGFKNYQRLFKDPVFYVAIKNTIFITVIVVVLQNIFGFLLALILNGRSILGRNIYRSVYFIPSLLSTIVICYTWIYILNVHVGVFGMVLDALGIENILKYDVFLKAVPALLTVGFTMVWQFSGYNMVIYLSGLQSVPNDVYESASIDGANSMQRLFYITLPLIVPSITINTLLNVIGCLRIFDQVYIMTKGGPGNTTETMGTYLYNSAFSSSQMGYGTAIASVLFLGTLVIAFIMVKFMRSKEVEL